MPWFRIPAPILIGIAGTAYVAASLVLFVTETPLGSTLFFSMAAVMVAAYAAVLARVWTDPPENRSLLLVAFGIAALIRLPLAMGPVGPDSDMVRYLWDGRVQLLGYNPYDVIPADPALAHTHTDETAAMPSRRHRTPYPPAAQLFFRFVASTWNSTRGVKLALTFCDLLTMIVVWRWLVTTGWSPWLSLAYGWHPLVVLEVSHSGHIDALGALWIAAAAYWLARRRTTLAAVAFVLAIATKLVPIVLAPLFVGRLARRDALLASALLALLYAPFAASTDTPLGAVPNVVARIRFNGPIFTGLAAAISPYGAAFAAVAVGLAAAAWARWKLTQDDPAAWAWPMALALACAPVVYPWYLLYTTPFLFSRTTLPVTAWTIGILPVYIVWRLAREGGRWEVPAAIVVTQYVVVLGTGASIWWHSRRARARRNPAAA